MTPDAWEPAVLTTLAVALVVSPHASARPVRTAAASRWRSRWVLLGAAGLATSGLAAGLRGTQLGLGLVLVLAGCLAHGVWAGSREGAVRDRRTDQVLLACESLSADLEVGQPPGAALDRVALEWEEFAPVAIAARLGADVPAALRELAVRPGADQLRVVAATWQVAHRSGSGLATALRDACAAIRSDRATRRVVSAELASARVTARLMAVLPFGVLLMGSGLGGDPVGFLLGTMPGLACLVVGVLLSYAGLRWLQAIADGVLPR